jgi:hypothetical protein
MELQEALSQIAEIRNRAAAAERFQGYRAVPVAASGLVALVAAAVQPILVPNPPADLAGYLALWLGIAVVAAVVAGSGIVVRHWSGRHPLEREMTLLAVSQFAPCLLAGALVTIALARHAPEMAWVLPGIWQVLFGLGIFASARLLPRAIVSVAVFFLVTGTLNLALGQGSSAFSPWGMGLPFGIGQMASAIVLYWNQESDHAG